MDNNELLQQVVVLLQEQTKTIGELMDTRIATLETRLDLKLENEVCHRIDALFDGYKLTHEKQWELEREVEQLKARLDEVCTRIGMAG
ncbi:MAG: hypothetical protein RR185_08295 [Angelakisella sp.]